MKTTAGIERERFIVDLRNDKIIPGIGRLLTSVWDKVQGNGCSTDLFGYELFAGQVEDRTPPCDSLEALRKALVANDNILNEAVSQFGWGFDFSEFAEEWRIRELAVNPFNERHKRIWASISPERRLAASRVAAIHVHIAIGKKLAAQALGLCDRETVNRLIKLGDHSQGKRIEAYRIMSQSDGIPPKFSSRVELMRYIQQHGGERNVWDLARYKPSTGTIEFRMFGTTGDIQEIIGYVEACLQVVAPLLH